MDALTQIADEDLDSLVVALRERYGYDFSGYARVSLRRRVLSYLHRTGLPDARALTARLMGDDGCFPHFLQGLTVPVTDMFRDPIFFKALRDRVLPHLASYPFIRVWHAGCSTGEEVFATAILFREAGLLERTRLYATDINTIALEKARQGIFPLRHMQTFTRNYLLSGGQEAFAGYYRVSDDEARFDPALREGMVFARHNLVSDSSFNEFHLILCRNVLIYFGGELQRRVLELFRQSLRPLGYLALGEKETLAEDARRYFQEVDGSRKLYRFTQPPPSS